MIWNGLKRQNLLFCIKFNKTNDKTKAWKPNISKLLQAGAEGLEPSTLGFGDLRSTNWTIPLYPFYHIPSKLHTELPSSSGQALDRLVTVSSMHCCTSTSALSTSYSPRGLTVFRQGHLISGRASRLDAFSVYPFRAWLPCCAFGMQQVHQRPVQPGPLVLGPDPLRSPPPAPDRDRTVSRRSEPSSRTALMGEQPNPWDLLQPQDAMSRHRGAKPLRRCGLLGVISLLSPG